MKQIKASSITEVVVAMAVLGVVMTISLNVFDSLYHSSPSLKEKQISMMIDSHIIEMKAYKDLTDDRIEYDGFYITTEFSEYLDNDRLKVCFLSAFKKVSGDLIMEKRILLND